MEEKGREGGKRAGTAYDAPWEVSVLCAVTLLGGAGRQGRGIPCDLR